MFENLLTPWIALGFVILVSALLSLTRQVPLRVRLVSLAAVLVYGGISLPYTANLALGHLENEARQLQSRCVPPPEGSVFIVLAGGIHHDGASPMPHVDQLSVESLRRLIAAEHFAAQVPKSELLLSGGGGERWTEADLMGELARRLGFPASRILIDQTSHTTLQSAYAVRHLLKTGRVKGPLYVVTSAYHMPRAMLSFKLGGVQVCAFPVDFRAIHDRPWDMLMPSLGAVHKIALVMHEYLGDFYYRWRASSE